MAKLPDEILTTIFNLQRQMAEGIEEASAAEWALLEQYGETASNDSRTRGTSECKSSANRSSLSASYAFAQDSRVSTDGFYCYAKIASASRQK